MASLQRNQCLFQRLPQVFMLRRQLQRLPEMSSIHVMVEARLVGRDLEQNAAGSAEVDCPEVIAVDHWRNLITGVGQRLAHLKLLRAILDSEGDVVHGPRALLAKTDLGQRFDVDVSKHQKGISSLSVA